MSGGDPLAPYFDAEGRLHTWPAKRLAERRSAILARLAERFEAGRPYREAEVNAALREACVIDDPALFRRELVDAGLLERDAYGAAYRRAAPSEPDPPET